MNPWLNESAWPRQSHVIERLQDSIGGLLLRTLTRKYEMPVDEAEALLRRVLLSMLLLDAQVKDAEAWLIAAICDSGRAWRRARALDERMSADPNEDIVALRGLVFRRRALTAIPDSGRAALRLRFQYRYSFEEIGAELGVTAKYAELLVMRSLARIRQIEEGQR
jgi:DNA-directed RNA polymerase specialized sigma24 family protein